MPLINLTVSGCLVGLLCTLVFALMHVCTRRRKDVPPGPPVWPIVGNLFSLTGRNVLGTLAGMRKTYGDVFGLYIGGELNIFLNGYEVIQEAFVKKGSVFSRRPLSTYAKLLLTRVGIVFANGAEWKEHRRFALNAFRELCFSKSELRIEDRVNEELMYFVERLGQFDKPVDLSTDINYSLANVIFSILHGRRIGYENKLFVWYQSTLDNEFKVFAKNQVLINCFPFLHKLPFDILGIQQSRAISAEFQNYFSNMCQDNFANHVKGNEKCLVDYYITEMKDNAEFERNNSFTDGKLWIHLHDLMAAGSETTATTIKWILLHLIRNPEIQEKAHAEIDRILGRVQVPCVSDRNDMPYVHAVILEGLRIGHVVPFGIPHSVSHDVVFRGYLIPKNTTVFANLPSVLKDPDVFSEPETFRPERFMTEDRKSVQVREEFIPFSLGPRSCMGESIARIELFLYVTTLLQKFEFRAPDGEDMPMPHGIMSVTHYPNKYRVKLYKR